MKKKIIISILSLICIYILCVFSFYRGLTFSQYVKVDPIYNRINYQTVYKATVGEAIGENEEGITATVLVFRNRLQKGMKLGSVALKRKDLDEFIARQPKKKLEKVKQIVKDVFDGNVYDFTYGSVYFENVELYGEPYWIKDIIKTVKIGNHTFYKED